MAGWLVGCFFCSLVGLLLCLFVGWLVDLLVGFEACETLLAYLMPTTFFSL